MPQPMQVDWRVKGAAESVVRFFRAGEYHFVWGHLWQLRVFSRAEFKEIVRFWIRKKYWPIFPFLYLF